MARPMTSVAVGRVNRRFLFLALILATLSAVLVYAAISRSGEGGSSGGGDIRVVVAKEAIDAGTPITEGMLVEKRLPRGAVGESPFRDIEQAVGKVARFPIAASEPVLQSKVVGVLDASTASNDVLRNIIESGQRGLAIETSAVIGAGGLLLPGDHVDVLWIPNDPAADMPAQLIAENVEVLAVEQTLVEVAPSAPGLEEDTDSAQSDKPAGQRVPGSEAAANPGASTVTLLVTPAQAQQIFCGEQSGEIRLAVRAFGDDGPSGIPSIICIVRGSEREQQQP